MTNTTREERLKRLRIVEIVVRDDDDDSYTHEEKPDFILNFITAEISALKMRMVEEIEGKKLRKGKDVGEYKWEEVKCDFNQGLTTAKDIVTNTE